MKMEKRSRRDIKRTNVDHKKEVGKKLKDTGKIVKDKGTVVDTAGLLNLAGTREGADVVKKATTDAGKATDAAFQKGERDFQHKTITKLQKMEQELGQRSKATAQDIQRIKGAAGKIDTKQATGKLKAAESGAESDKKFVDESQKRETTDRKKGQQDMKNQSRKIKSTRIHFSG